MEVRFDSFLAQYNHSPEAREIVAAERDEIALYRQYKDYYSYSVYVARNVSGAQH